MKNKDSKWILKWESRHPYFRMEFYFRGEKAGFAYGSMNKKLLGISRNNVLQCYYDEHDQKWIHENSLRILLDKKKMIRYFEETEQTAQALFGLLNIETPHEDAQKLKQHIKNIVLEYMKFYTSYDLSRPEYFEIVEKKLKQKFTDVDFSIMTTPIELTTLDNERIDFLNIVISNNFDKLAEHQAKYGWIGASEDKHPWGLDFFQKQFQSLSKKQAEKELEMKKNNRKELHNNQLNIETKSDSETIYLCNVVRKIAHLRLESRLNWARADRLINKMLSDIAIRFGTTFEDIQFYNENDILGLIDGRKLDDSILSKRKQAYAFKYDETSFNEYAGEEDVRLLEEAEGVGFKQVNLNIIKGNIANKGVARGHVKIINAFVENQTEASEKMKAGDILVTGMTRPHLMPAILKAAAIVTDEGGITSHAAIVSRELKKPCIIGTKIATKVLKDGDLVEVDANSGNVIIIKRAQINND